MSEHFEYIDAYFQKQLNESEKKEFEQRCLTDEEFASDVALYVSSRSALREMLLEEKKIQWGMSESDEVTATISPVRKMNTTRWIAYAAAACLVLAIIVFPFLSKDSPQELADNYVNENLESMSQTMDASSDSVQLGLAAYNKKDYPTAMQFFQGVYRSHPENTDALKYIGQTHLLTGNFEGAIAAFDELSQKKMFANEGLLLKAVTLMKRNAGNDQEVAKGVLQKIVEGDSSLVGKREAEKWLKNWPDK